MWMKVLRSRSGGGSSFKRCWLYAQAAWYVVVAIAQLSWIWLQYERINHG